MPESREQVQESGRAWRAEALAVIDELVERIDGFLGTGRPTTDPYWLALFARIDKLESTKDVADA